ncbi:MAG: DUF3307 domain-containing protein [Chloroflexi bacterium]|nr:MAG: DUF3307 domain-containing protein [Chloroflexota bacterium]
MIVSMLLAHLVGDYILQWNKLAYWKSRELKGVTVHCLIVLGVTWLFALPFDPTWWDGVLLISGLHFLIDASQLLLKPRIAPMARFALDQVAHFLVIFMVLAWSGFLDWSNVTVQLTAVFHNDRLLLYLLGYAFVTMPAWVIIKFLAYGLVQGDAPEFGGNSKYLGIAERVLMTTFVAMGQFLLVPLVAAPRLFMEWREINANEQTAVYLAELLVSVILAVLIGLALSTL